MPPDVKNKCVFDFTCLRMLMHPFITTIDQLIPVDDGNAYVVGEVSEGVTLE